MDRVKNKEELILFLKDMKSLGKIANLDSYIEWIQLNKRIELNPSNSGTIRFKMSNGEFNEQSIRAIK